MYLCKAHLMWKTPLRRVLDPGESLFFFERVINFQERVPYFCGRITCLYGRDSCFPQSFISMAQIYCSGMNFMDYLRNVKQSNLTKKFFRFKNPKHQKCSFPLKYYANDVNSSKKSNILLGRRICPTSNVSSRSHHATLSGVP